MLSPSAGRVMLGEQSVYDLSSNARARLRKENIGFVFQTFTGNLDPETSQQVIGYLDEFNQEGRTIVMVTHDPQAAARAKRTLKLHSGRIVGEEIRQPVLHVA